MPEIDTRKLKIIPEDEVVLKSENQVFVQRILDILLKKDQRQEQALEALKIAVNRRLDSIESKFDNSLISLKDQVTSLFVEDRVKAMSVGQEKSFNKLRGDIISLINQKIKEVDYKVEQRAKPGPPGPKGEPGRPPLSNEIDLAIKPTVESFRKEWEEKVQQTMARRGVGVGGGPSANAVQYVDLSSQLNGSTTTFNTPKFRQALLMIGTQFPILYRPTTDFTIKNGQVSLVTDQVSAPAAGQSLILLYIK